MIRFKLTTYQRQVIIGTLLGDAHAETQNKGTTFRLKFEQSSKHKDYLFHLYEIFSNCCKSEPSQNLNKNWRFSTLSSVSFRFYGQYFYNNQRKKRIPKNIGRFLTSIALAYWYMDDGSKKCNRSKGVRLSTNCFSYNDVLLLVTVLNQKFGLVAKPARHMDSFIIYISSQSSVLFFSLIGPYIHPSMIYKIPEMKKEKTLKQE